MKITLITSHGFLYMQNPTTIQVFFDNLLEHYELAYADDNWKFKVIYTSLDRDVLVKYRDKIIDEIAKGETKIDIR